ncbi:MAG: NfeD family protein [Magnetococcales bacterium]|nr:NfeD family protein [Magnetococcales bacterium]
MMSASWELLSVPWERMDSWHWWGLAAGLLVVELLSPAFFCLWLAVAALLTGGLRLLFPEWSWQSQWFVFAALSVSLLVLWHRLRGRERSVPSTLNRRGEHYLGRIVCLETPMVQGMGRARVDDSSWKLVGPDLPAGRSVRVIAIEGNALRVEPVGTAADPG